MVQNESQESVDYKQVLQRKFSDLFQQVFSMKGMLYISVILVIAMMVDKSDGWSKTFIFLLVVFLVICIMWISSVMIFSNELRRNIMIVLNAFLIIVLLQVMSFEKMVLYVLFNVFMSVLGQRRRLPLFFYHIFGLAGYCILAFII